MEKQYYVVVAGLRNVNFTNEPVSNHEEACESAYGFYHPDFKSYPIGPNLPKESAISFVIKNGLNITKQ